MNAMMLPPHTNTSHSYKGITMKWTRFRFIVPYASIKELAKSAPQPNTLHLAPSITHHQFYIIIEIFDYIDLHLTKRPLNPCSNMII